MQQCNICSWVQPLNSSDKLFIDWYVEIRNTYIMKCDRLYHWINNWFIIHLTMKWKQHLTIHRLCQYQDIVCCQKTKFRHLMLNAHIEIWCKFSFSMIMHKKNLWNHNTKIKYTKFMSPNLWKYITSKIRFTYYWMLWFLYQKYTLWHQHRQGR